METTRNIRALNFIFAQKGLNIATNGLLFMLLPLTFLVPYSFSPYIQDIVWGVFILVLALGFRVIPEYYQKYGYVKEKKMNLKQIAFIIVQIILVCTAYIVIDLILNLKISGFFLVLSFLSLYTAFYYIRVLKYSIHYIVVGIALFILSVLPLLNILNKSNFIYNTDHEGIFLIFGLEMFIIGVINHLIVLKNFKKINTKEIDG